MIADLRIWYVYSSEKCQNEKIDKFGHSTCMCHHLYGILPHLFFFLVNTDGLLLLEYDVGKQCFLVPLIVQKGFVSEIYLFPNMYIFNLQSNYFLFQDVSSSNEELNEKWITFLLNYLYDKDFVSEETILDWYDTLDQNCKFHSRVKPFVNWLREAEEASSSDSD